MRGETVKQKRWLRRLLSSKWPRWNRRWLRCAGVVDIEKIKCEKCGRTLLLAELLKGEIKCPRCGTINRIEYPQREEHIKRTSE